MIKIAITSEKGGTGKTTSSVNISAILAERGFRVLMIDADPQSYTTYYTNVKENPGPCLSDAIMNGVSINDCISATEFGFDVIRGNIRDARNLDDFLAFKKFKNEQYALVFKLVMAELDEDAYDFAIIDCPPLDGNLLDNIHVYTDYLIIPIEPTQFAFNSLEMKLESIMRIRAAYNPQLSILGSLITKGSKKGFSKNEIKLAYEEALKEDQLLNFFETTIEENDKLSDATNAFEPISSYSKRSNGNKDYQNLVTEILGRLGIDG